MRELRPGTSIDSWQPKSQRGIPELRCGLAPLPSAPAAQAALGSCRPCSFVPVLPRALVSTAQRKEALLTVCMPKFLANFLGLLGHHPPLS